MHVLLFLESVGTTELLVILVAALILFGPRRLPELSRSLGKSLSEFKRASDLDPVAMREAVASSAGQFFGERARKDDITMVFARITT